MMMLAQAHAAQVHKANLLDEIPDGISSSRFPLYRTGWKY
jgi:hypothetical protein